MHYDAPHSSALVRPGSYRLASASKPEWAALVVPAVLSTEVVEILAEALTRLNELFLRADPYAPLLYESGAFYRQQPEYWLTVPWAMVSTALGHGLDCKSLAAWRTAELRVRGGEPDARCIVSAHPTPERMVYHVRVRRRDGRIEDPSAVLGMHSALPGGAQTLTPELGAWPLQLPPSW